MQAEHEHAVCPHAHAVLMEVQTCLNLFGGAKQLLQNVWESALEGLAVTGDHRADSPLETVRWAVAPHARAAWWLAQTQPALDLEEALIQLQTTPQELKRNLLPLSSHVLDLPQAHHRLLEQCGLYTLGHLLDLPRDALARRFSPHLLEQLDEALGNQSDAVVTAAVSEPFAASADMPFHATQQTAIEQVAKTLLVQLELWLKNRKLKAMRTDWQFKLAHRSERLSVHSSQGAWQANQWLELLHHQLTRVEFEDDVRTVVLQASNLQSAVDLNQSLLPADSNNQQALGEVADLIRARLGPNAMTQWASISDPRPEQAQQAIPLEGEPAAAGKSKAKVRRSTALPKRRFACAPAGSHTQLPELAQRPLCVLAEPEPIRGPEPHWNGRGLWTLLSGPERIEFGWWTANPCQRDYYRAINRELVQAWLFCEPQRVGEHTQWRWYVHGYFA